MKKNTFRITKTKLLDDGFNSMEGHYWYYLYYFRIYHEDGKRYYRYAFVVNFTGEDYDEFRYDEETDSYADDWTPKDYADELASSFIYSYKHSYEEHDKFFEACKESIEEYNRRIACDYDNSTIWGMACELTRKMFGETDRRIRV